MSGAGNYCRTDSAVPQSAAGAGPRSSTGLGEWRGWGPWGGGGGGGVVAPDPRAYIWNTPPHLAIPVQLFLNTPSQLAIHAPSCGDSGSPYILSCPVIYILAKDNLEFPTISSAGGATNTMIA